MQFLRSACVVVIVALLGINMYATIQNGATTDKQLTVYTYDGSKTSFLFSDFPLIEFKEDKMVVTANDMAVEYNIESIAKIDYVDNTSDDKDEPRPPIITGIPDINDPDEDSRPFTISRQQLVFQGLDANTKVHVISLDGRIVGEATAKNRAQQLTIPIGHLQAGLYLVKVGSLTYKIVLT